MRRFRVALGLTTLALSTIGAYACSSDDDADPGTTPDASVPETSTEQDATPPEPLDAGEQLDAQPDAEPVTPECTGNPLAADGGGVELLFDAGASHQIAAAAAPFGPQWVENFPGQNDAGQLVYTEFSQVRISQVGQDGGTPVTFAFTDDPGLSPAQNEVKDGYVYTAAHRLNPNVGGAIFRTPVDAGPNATPQRLALFDAGVFTPHGVVVTKKGLLYFTDPAYQSTNFTTQKTFLFRMPADGGTATTVATYDNKPGDRIVGIALSRDETFLFVSFSDARRISRFSLDPATGLASGETALAFKPTLNPVGIALDEGGNIWISETNNAGDNGLVEVIDATGTQKWATFEFPDSHPTGISFGGADRKTVFVTAERGFDGDPTGSVFKVSLPTRCPGVL